MFVLRLLSSASLRDVSCLPQWLSNFDSSENYSESVNYLTSLQLQMTNPAKIYNFLFLKKNACALTEKDSSLHVDGLEFAGSVSHLTPSERTQPQ